MSRITALDRRAISRQCTLTRAAFRRLKKQISRKYPAIVVAKLHITPELMSDPCQFAATSVDLPPEIHFDPILETLPPESRTAIIATELLESLLLLGCEPGPPIEDVAGRSSYISELAEEIFGFSIETDFYGMPTTEKLEPHCPSAAPMQQELAFGF